MSLLCQWKLIIILRSREVNGGHCRSCQAEACFCRRVPRLKKKVIVTRSIDSQVQAAEWKEQPSGNRNDLTHRKRAANPLKYIQSHVDQIVFFVIQNDDINISCTGRVYFSFIVDINNVSWLSTYTMVRVTENICNCFHAQLNWAVFVAWISCLIRLLCLPQHNQKGNRFVVEIMLHSFIFLVVGPFYVGLQHQPQE